MSFNDVIQKFMKVFEQKEFYDHILREHKNRMQKIKSGEYIESDNNKDALTKK